VAFPRSPRRQSTAAPAGVANIFPQARAVGSDWSPGAGFDLGHRFSLASAAFVAFLTGAATAAGIVPVILSSWPDWLQVVFIVLSGLLFIPVGALLGVAPQPHDQRLTRPVSAATTTLTSCHYMRSRRGRDLNRRRQHRAGGPIPTPEA
jgi:MFS family permease